MLAILLFAISFVQLAACGATTQTANSTPIGKRDPISQTAPIVTPGFTPQPTATPTTAGQVCVSCGTPPTFTPTPTATPTPTPTPTITPTPTPAPLDMRDKSPNGNHLTNHGGTPVYTNLPIAGDTKAIHLAAASMQSASAPNSASLSITGDLTIEAFINSDSLPPTNSVRDIVAKWTQQGPQKSYMLVLANQGGVYKVGFYCSHDGSTGLDFLSNSLSLDPGNWYQIAAVYNASQGQVHFYYTSKNPGFWQTQDAGTATGLPTSLYNSSTGLTIGVDGNPFASDYYDGQLNEVRIWSVARSTSDISANALNQLSGSEPGLVAYYPF